MCAACARLGVFAQGQRPRAGWALAFRDPILGLGAEQRAKQGRGRGSTGPLVGPLWCGEATAPPSNQANLGGPRNTHAIAHEHPNNGGRSLSAYRHTGRLCSSGMGPSWVDAERKHGLGSKSTRRGLRD
eukprot:1141515-Pelagomonas_calceolata.AAC.14